MLKVAPFFVVLESFSWPFLFRVEWGCSDCTVGLLRVGRNSQLNFGGWWRFDLGFA